MKTHIIGRDCRDGEFLAFPLACCMLLLDMQHYKKGLKSRIQATTQSAQEVNAMERVPLPQMVLDMLGLEEAPELPDEFRDQMAQRHGNEVDRLVAMLRAEVVVRFLDQYYPLVEPRLATAEEALAARVL